MLFTVTMEDEDTSKESSAAEEEMELLELEEEEELGLLMLWFALRALLVLPRGCLRVAEHWTWGTPEREEGEVVNCVMNRCDGATRERLVNVRTMKS